MQSLPQSVSNGRMSQASVLLRDDTDGYTDGPTDGRTDGQADTPDWDDVEGAAASGGWDGAGGRGRRGPLGRGALAQGAGGAGRAARGPPWGAGGTQMRRAGSRRRIGGGGAVPAISTDDVRLALLSAAGAFVICRTQPIPPQMSSSHGADCTG